MTRFCVSCELHLDVFLFRVDRRARDGYTDQCLSCISQSAPPVWKICSRCVEPLKLTEFPKHSQTKDKLHPECRLCKSKRDKKYFCANKDQLTIQNKKYREKNKDQISRSKKEYVENNREKVVDYRQSYYQDNKLVLDEKHKNYQKTNPQIRKEITHRYYLNNKLYYKLKCIERAARKRKLTIQKFSSEEFNQRMSVFGDKCFYCGGPFEHVDHAIALIRNGYHCLANLRPSCKLCNLRKGSKSFSQFLLEINRETR